MLIAKRYAMIALSILGSATLLFSCSTKSASPTYDYETLMTESSENRTIIMMDNGKRSYMFTSPLMEGYSLATNPYQEFRRGIHMTTYTDSLALIDATITANYAIYYERQKLWEAKGNVVIIKNNRSKGDTTVTGLTEIYTQQLFWNATTKKIYSNVDTKVLQPDGWHFGVGFDADEDLKNIHFRKYSSEMEFDMSQPTEEERAEREAKKESEKSNSNSSGSTTTSGTKSRDNNSNSRTQKFNSENITPTHHNVVGGNTERGKPQTLPSRPNINGENSSNKGALLKNNEVLTPQSTPKKENVTFDSQSFNLSTDFDSEAKLMKN